MNYPELRTGYMNIAPSIPKEHKNLQNPHQSQSAQIENIELLKEVSKLKDEKIQNLESQLVAL